MPVRVRPLFHPSINRFQHVMQGLEHTPKLALDQERLGNSLLESFIGHFGNFSNFKGRRYQIKVRWYQIIFSQVRVVRKSKKFGTKGLFSPAYFQFNSIQFSSDSSVQFSLVQFSSALDNTYSHISLFISVQFQFSSV